MIDILINVFLIIALGASYMANANNLQIVRNQIEKEAHKKNMLLHRDVRELAARVLELEQLVKEHRQDESVHVKQYDACDCDDEDEGDDDDEARVYDVDTGSTYVKAGTVIREKEKSFLVLDPKTKVELTDEPQ